MHALIDSLMSYFGSIGYLDIFILMTMESSIIPVPSELVMIPAGISAVGWNIDPIIATIIGWLGSVLWAILNYWIIGRWLWKPFLEKYGKYILITHEKYKKTEDLFLKNGNLYTFIGRLLPVIRHLISIPAGIFRMKMTPFISITFLWATLWCGILVALGYYFWESVIEITKKYWHELTYIAIPCIAVYVWYKIFKK
jgi:membrane protein DedA with SNARE-associated domain